MKDKKSLARMDKLELFTLLQEITDENDRLRAYCHQLEDANAKLALSNHELNEECDALHRELQALQAELANLRQGQEIASALPAGSFAQAMVEVQEIVQHTQMAADAYLERVRQETEDAQGKSDAILAQARQQAEEIVSVAQERKEGLERETREISQRLRSEMERLQHLMEETTASGGESL